MNVREQKDFSSQYDRRDVLWQKVAAYAGYCDDCYYYTIPFTQERWADQALARHRERKHNVQH